LSAPSHLRTLAPSHLRTLAPSHPRTLPDLARHLRDAQDALNAHGTAAAPINDWAAFLEDGFDPAAIDAALQRTRDEIARGRPSVQPSIIDWAASRTRARLTRLPEALDRFRTMVASGGRSMEAVERSAVLAESFQLLRGICATSRQLKRLPFALDPWQIGQVPISALFAWPDAVRWPVELFEAMLQEIWTSHDGSNTFLSRKVRLGDVNAAPVDTHVVPTPNDHAQQASLLLALEWLRCALGQQSDDARISAALAQAIATMANAGTRRRRYAGATLVVSLQTGTSPDKIDLAVPVARSAFARHLTGAEDEPRSASHELLSVHTDTCRASIVLAPIGTQPTAAVIVSARARMFAPRVLTDEGLAGALVMYRCDRGAACVLFQRNESVVVAAGGSVQTRHRWPRPIVAELPFGDEGAVAWGDGLSAFPDRVGCGYVMYKSRRDGEVVIQDLPVRPTIGRWWQGRLYWNCHPRRVESPTGLFSWAPGDAAPRPELPELPATLGFHSSEAGLTFELGGGPIQGGRWVRRFERRGWTWRPGMELRPVDVGPFGAAAARDTHGTWTAIAHPEADLIRLETPGRGLSIACYYPVGLAWVGDSLLVGTIEQELLLFENLAARLGEQG
jgi:hypothetical protein